VKIFGYWLKGTAAIAVFASIVCAFSLIPSSVMDWIKIGVWCVLAFSLFSGMAIYFGYALTPHRCELAPPETDPVAIHIHDDESKEHF
jgi:hypothetical protein